MKINFKPGTEVRLLTTELLRGLIAFAELAGELWVTSVNEGRHKPGSLHYVGKAVDIRSKAFVPDKKKALLAAFKEAYDQDYDLILESEGQPFEHFHLEYDPGNENR